MDDGYRRSPVRDGNAQKNCGEYYCPGDERAGRSRAYEMNNPKCTRQGDAESEHELCKLSEEKTSDEGSATEVDVNENGHGDVRHQCESCLKKYENSSRDCASCPYGKCATHRPKSGNAGENAAGTDVGSAICQVPTAPNLNQRFRNYVGNPINFPQAFVAMQQLKKLKELQRKRDHCERFYSQEIRRLIGESFFENAAIVPAPMKARERIPSPGIKGNVPEPPPCVDQRNRGGGYTKELEPSGTMTTITRFNCGCMEETTIPIFNTTIGHVNKCENHRYQERTRAGGSPQELAYQGDPIPNPGRSRGKSCIQNPHERETWDDRKSRRRRRSGNSSPQRPSSPAQITDASSNEEN